MGIKFTTYIVVCHEEVKFRTLTVGMRHKQGWF